MQKQQRGEQSEAIARSWMEAQGYRFLEANYNRRIGELDLIVEHPDGRTIVFVEVRYRFGEHFGGAIASVDYAKQRKLRRTAKSWLQKHACSMTPARIDVIGLSPASEGAATEQLRSPRNHIWLGHGLQWIINAVED